MTSETDLDKLHSNLNKLLQDWQVDIPKQISSFDNSQNLFRILSMENMEIKHSNLLGWLLNVTESHHLKDTFFKNFMRQLIHKHKDMVEISIFSKDWTNSVVLREYKHIDILFHNDTNAFNLVIENKIDSHEHGSQLQNYEQVIKNEYSQQNDQTIYVFLTLNGEAASRDNWLTLTYTDVIKALEETLSKTTSIELKVRMILEDYISLLEELTNFNLAEKQQIATEIWNQYRQVLTFINDYRFDPQKGIQDEFKDLLAKNCVNTHLQFKKRDCDEYHIRFKTEYLNKRFDDNSFGEKNNAWNNNAKYYYEIVINLNNNKRVYGQLSFKLANCNQNIEHTKKLHLEHDGPDWLVHKFHFKNMQVEFYNNLNQFNPQQIKDQCKGVFDEFIKKIDNFESNLTESK